ncbi:MAG TPA: peptidylprolyl isomerase [Gemmatimonadota bacterium]|nr:peptidylprolyl isomerase [Gemmatimonadota bacterium]
MRVGGPGVLAILLAIIASASPGAVLAQAGEPSLPERDLAVAPLLTDRIVAVVGSTPLLESEWREQTLLLAEQLGIPPGTPQFERIARESFEQLIQDLIIVAAAERDTTIRIEAEQVAEAADRELEAIRTRFPSEEEFLRQLGQSQWGSLAVYRRDLMERKRRELLGQAFLETRRDEIRPLPVSDADVRAYWEENRAAIGTSPQTFRFEELPVTVKPTAAARDSARAEAERVLAEIRAGGDFAMLAREHSDDPTGREAGGDLGWFGRGRMVPAFEAAAFDAPLGEVVGPVETPFGFHLLQATDRRTDEVRARHILFAFERTPEDLQRAREEADMLLDLILSGADVDSLQAAYLPGDSAAAAIIELAASQLPEVYASALQSLASGAATVIETGTGFSVIISHGTAGSEAIQFEQIAPRIRQQLALERAEAAFVERLRRSVYVDIRITLDELFPASAAG